MNIKEKPAISSGVLRVFELYWIMSWRDEGRSNRYYKLSISLYICLFDFCAYT